jgi:hypothetical protein
MWRPSWRSSSATRVPTRPAPLREVTLQELQRELAKAPTAKKHRIIALKSFFSFLREVEAVRPSSQDATLGLKVPPLALRGC